jgi:uncharacterized repeat protein (TIGR02543 family)
MNTTKIFTKAIFVVSILLSALLIGCNDMIEPMAQVELTVRMDDHNIPLTSSFTLYGTKQESRATIQKVLGSLHEISLLPLEPGIWNLTVEAKVEGILKATGSRTVTVTKGQKVSAVIDLAYEYDLTFNANEGTPPSMAGKDVIYDAEYGPLATTERTGYNFLGWYTAINGGTKIEETDKFTQTTNHVLYAHWEANSYSITFDMQQGSGGSASTTATYDAAMQSGLTVPSRTGYTFGGYYDAANGGGTQYYTATMASARTWDKTAPNTTLYAKWIPISYTITYNLNDGTNNAGNPAAYTIEITTIAFLAPTRTGYTFGGWYATDTFSGSALTTIPQGSSGAKTLYAKWAANSYSVTFDKQEGVGGSDVVNGTYDAAMPSAAAPTRIGFTFGGYYDAAGGGGIQYYSDAMDSMRSWDKTGMTTLYAKWTANTNTAYKVEHYQQDVSTNGYTLNETENLTGTTATTATAAAKSYTGFTENTTYGLRVPSGTVAADGTLVLKLYYDRNVFTVNFVENEGSAVSDLTGVRYAAKIAAPTAPTRTGYGFGGWYKDEGLASAWSFGSDTVTENITLFAKWNPHSNTQYKVEHYHQDVSASTYTLENSDSMVGTTASTVSATPKMYEGFTENTTHESRVPSGTVAADGTLVLKLYYDRKVFTVSFRENNGSDVPDLTGVRYGATIASPTAPIRIGYGFGEWCKDAVLTTAWAFNTDTVIRDATLYAKWTPNTNTAYKVEHYQQDVSTSAYTLKETEDLTGTTDAMANATAKTYTDFTENTSHTSRVASGRIAAAGTLVLRLYYDRNVYSVCFEEKGGNPVSDLTGVQYGTKILAPTAPSRTGYSFGGWYKDEGLASAWTFNTDTVIENITLYAKWAPNTNTAYKVEHYQQDISGSGYTKFETDSKTGTTATSVTAAAKSYAGFIENTGHASRVPSGTVAADGTLVLKLYYDRNVYTVRFEENGGSAVSDLTEVRYGAKISAPTTVPTKTGYSLGGWYKDSGLTAVWAFNTDTVTANITLYAKWTANTNTAYKVEHYQQDVSTSGYTLKETENKTGTTATTATTAAKSYTGFSENQSHASRVPSGTVAADGTLVLKLYYDRNVYTVRFEENGGNPVSDWTGVRYGAKISAPTTPGYGFVGWYKDASLTNAWSFGSDTVTTNTTLYAKWQVVEIGSIGPAGGYIFYDKGSYSSGWRFMEAAPSDIPRNGTDRGYVFGFYRETPTGANLATDATDTAIGTGKANTAKLVGKMKTTAYISPDSSITTTTAAYAAKVADDYTVTNGGVTYSDWFLPSKDELNEIYRNLKVKNLGNFSTEQYISYWTSTDWGDADYAMYQEFDNGYQGWLTRKDNGERVRPVRAF